jgi:transglutaminase-like putative cysteine protease
MKIDRLALSSALALLAMSTGGAASAQKARAVAAKAPSQPALPQPAFGAVPAWVVAEATPAPNPKRKDDPFEFLLSSSQEYLTKDGVENYVEYAVRPMTQAGLQAIGNVTIPWNAHRTSVTLNRVHIERDGKVIDALDRGDVSVMRRETQLEKSSLNGLLTVVMPVKRLQVGDTLRVGFTYKTKPGQIGRPEEVHDFASPMPIGRSVRRIVTSNDVPMRWFVADEFKSVPVKELPGAKERTFVVTNHEPAKKRNFVPDRFKRKLVQASAYSDWNEVASVLMPAFEAARKTEAKSEVAQLADKISAAHKDPRERLLAALRASQDQVRYVALLLGDGDYKPMSADEVWEQRFGDCKGKTALLLALLDRMGIQAEPMLASVKFDDGLQEGLPSLALFDHVLVRAHVGGETFYLDGTQFGQRTIEEMKQSPTMHGLPLIANSRLIRTPDVMPSAPLVETTLVWDARNGPTAEAPFEATLVLRGTAAADMRTEAAASSDKEKLLEKLKNLVPGVSNDALDHVSTVADAADGSYVARFKGTVDLDWSPVEGLKGNRLQLTQGTLVWNAEFDREDAAAKHLPVAMTFPYWERNIEKVLLPNAGRDYVLDAKPIDQQVAVTHMARTVSMADGVVTAVSDFRRLKREMDPATAVSAKPVLTAIGENYAYIVSRKKLKLATAQR